MKKRLLATVLAAVMVISGTQIAGATSLSQARSQKNQAQNKLDSVNSQIAACHRWIPLEIPQSRRHPVQPGSNED